MVVQPLPTRFGAGLGCDDLVPFLRSNTYKSLKSREAR